MLKIKYKRYSIVKIVDIMIKGVIRDTTRVVYRTREGQTTRILERLLACFLFLYSFSILYFTLVGLVAHVPNHCISLIKLLHSPASTILMRLGWLLLAFI